jgi:hypothetical protein
VANRKSVGSWDFIEYDVLESVPYGHIIRRAIMSTKTCLSILSFLWSNFWWNLRRRGLIFRLAKQYNQQAQVVVPLLPETVRASVKINIRKYSVAFARMAYQSRMLSLAIAVIWAGGIDAYLFCTNSWSDRSHFSNWPGLLAFSSLLVLGQKLSTLQRWVLYGCALIVSGAIALMLTPNYLDRVEYVLLRGHGWQGFFWTVTLSIFYLMLFYLFQHVIIDQLLWGKYFRTVPDAIIVHNMICALDHLKVANGSVKLTERASAIRHLESAAVCMEAGVPRALSVPRGPASQKVLDRCRGAAAEIRELQASVGLAENDQDINVRTRLAHIAKLMMSRSLFELPVSNFAAESRFNVIRAVGRSLKLCIVAAIPGAFIIILRYFNVKVSPPFYNWAVVGAVIWAAVTIISMLDPLYAARLNAIGQMVSGIRGRAD